MTPRPSDHFAYWVNFENACKARQMRERLEKLFAKSGWIKPEESKWRTM